MELFELYRFLIFGVAFYFTVSALSAWSDAKKQPKRYLTAQVIKAIGFFLAALTM